MSPAPRGQNARNIALRYLFFTLGLLINSFGIAFITKSGLGTSQISSCLLYTSPSPRDA